jgi:hypothetical protein
MRKKSQEYRNKLHMVFANLNSKQYDGKRNAFEKKLLSELVRLRIPKRVEAASNV